MSWPKTAAWWFMMLLAFAIGVYALSYFYFPDMIDPEFKTRFDAIPWSARLHIFPGGLALIVGAFQFHSGLRERWTNIHRNCGRAYVVFVLSGAMGGLLLAWHAPHSPATRLGFASLAVVWFYSGAMAYFAIRAGNIALHRQWMIRSYALTLAAVTLRIQLPLYQGALGMSFDEAYAIVAWFCWIPNLIIAEWFFNQAPLRLNRPAV
jgi:uncharacterized membrane protein